MAAHAVLPALLVLLLAAGAHAQQSCTTTFPYSGCKTPPASQFQIAYVSSTPADGGNGEVHCFKITAVSPAHVEQCSQFTDLRKFEFDVSSSCPRVRVMSYNGQPITVVYGRATGCDSSALLKGTGGSPLVPVDTYARLQSSGGADVCFTAQGCTLAELCKGGACKVAFFSTDLKCCPVVSATVPIGNAPLAPSPPAPPPGSPLPLPPSGGNQPPGPSAACQIDPEAGILYNGRVWSNWTPVKGAGDPLAGDDWSNKGIPDDKQGLVMSTATDCNCMCASMPDVCVGWTFLGGPSQQCWLHSYLSFVNDPQGQYVDATTNNFVGVPTDTVLGRLVADPSYKWPVCTSNLWSFGQKVPKSYDVLTTIDQPTGLDPNGCNAECGNNNDCVAVLGLSATGSSGAQCQLLTNVGGGLQDADDDHPAAFTNPLQVCTGGGGEVFPSPPPGESPPPGPPVTTPPPPPPGPGSPALAPPPPPPSPGTLVPPGVPSSPAPSSMTPPPPPRQPRAPVPPSPPAQTASCGVDAAPGVRYTGEVWAGWTPAKDMNNVQDQPTPTRSSKNIPPAKQGQNTTSAAECNCLCAGTQTCAGYVWLGGDKKQCWLLSFVQWYGDTSITYTDSGSSNQLDVPDDTVTARVIRGSTWPTCQQIVTISNMTVVDAGSQRITGDVPLTVSSVGDCNAACGNDPACVAFTIQPAGGGVAPSAAPSGSLECTLLSEASSGLAPASDGTTVAPLQTCLEYIGAPSPPDAGSPSPPPAPGDNVVNPGSPPGTNPDAGTGTTSSAGSGGGGGSNHTGAIAGGVVGGVVGAAAIAGAVWWAAARRREFTPLV